MAEYKFELVYKPGQEIDVVLYSEDYSVAHQYGAPTRETPAHEGYKVLSPDLDRMIEQMLSKLGA